MGSFPVVLTSKLQTPGFDEGRDAELDVVVGLIQHLDLHVEGMVGQIDFVYFGLPEKDALDPQDRSDFAAIGLHFVHDGHLSRERSRSSEAKQRKDKSNSHSLVTPYQGLYSYPE